MAKYNDFVLYKGNHLHESDFFLMTPWEIASHKVNVRFKDAARAILSETKPGDLVLIEAPIEKFRKADLTTEFLHAQKLSASDAKYFRKSLNFYARLAEFARRYGRKVNSVDTGVMRSFNSKLYKLGEAKLSPSLTKEKELLAWQRNGLMCSRIEKLKPKMVIVAEAHAAFIENRFHPIKVISDYPEILRPSLAREAYEKMAELAILRKVRRAKINVGLGLDKPKIRKLPVKPKA